jgi:hypothetical protein
MGNQLTIGLNDSEKVSLNALASDYIFSMNHVDMEKLQDVEKCNKLIKVISERIEKSIPLSEIKKVFEQMQTKRDMKEAPIAIATFYVKIAHVYSAIVKTLNPTNNLCIRSPIRERQVPLGDLTNKKEGSKGNFVPLIELDMLYNDYQYDLESGEFKGRSNKMNKLYNQHLKSFYTGFTGSPTMDYKIKSFSDIPIGSYAKKVQPKCEDVACLFEQYAVNLSNSIHIASEAYENLTAIMDEMFSSEHIIRSDLTEQHLTNIVSRARKIILELYVECETSYEKGIQIYEAITNKILLETLKGQQNELMKQKIMLIGENSSY